MISLQYYIEEQNDLSQYQARVEIIIMRNGTVLLTKLKPYEKINKGYHGLPGGQINPKELQIKNVQEKALELLGIEINNIRRLDIDPLIVKNDQNKKNINFKGTVTNYYVADFSDFNRALIRSIQLKFDFYYLNQAILRMKKQAISFEDVNQRPIMQSRLEALQKVKKLYK